MRSPATESTGTWVGAPAHVGATVLSGDADVGESKPGVGVLTAATRLQAGAEKYRSRRWRACEEVCPEVEPLTSMNAAAPPAPSTQTTRTPMSNGLPTGLSPERR